MEKHTHIPLINGVYWYWRKDQIEPEAVLINIDRKAGVFFGSNGRIQAWLGKDEYLMGPQLPPNINHDLNYLPACANDPLDLHSRAIEEAKQMKIQLYALRSILRNLILDIRDGISSGEVASHWERVANSLCIYLKNQYPDEWEILPVGFKTHLQDFKKAVEFVKRETNDDAGYGFWSHLEGVLNKIDTQLNEKPRSLFPV